MLDDCDDEDEDEEQYELFEEEWSPSLGQGQSPLIKAWTKSRSFMSVAGWYWDVALWHCGRLWLRKLGVVNKAGGGYNRIGEWQFLGMNVSISVVFALPHQ